MAPLFRRVFACVARADVTDGVAQAAAEIAAQAGATLCLATVLPDAGAGSVAMDPVDFDVSRRAARQALERLAARLPLRLDPCIDVLSGETVPALLRAIRAHDADLVVLGHGRQTPDGGPGFSGAARAIAAAVDASVLVVPGGPRDREAPRCILAALDGSAHSEAALVVARRLAAARRTDLVMLHAVPEPSLGFDGPPDAESDALSAKVRQRASSAARKRLDTMRRGVPESGAACRLRMEQGEDPRRAILRAVGEESAGLLVFAARGTGRTPDLAIGSTADYLLAAARVPVLMVRGRIGAHMPDRARSVPRSRRPLAGIA